jgi:hypothetical protein
MRVTSQNYWGAYPAQGNTNYVATTLNTIHLGYIMLCKNLKTLNTKIATLAP